MSKTSRTPEVARNPGAYLHVPAKAATTTTSAIFQISNTKLYVPVVTLSVNDNIKFL